MVAPYLELYPEINNGAHRKAADLLGAPALVWHQALWTPTKDRRDRDHRACAIAVLIRSLYQHIADKFGGVEEPPSADGIRVEALDRVRVITLIFRWSGIRAKIRFEIHTEYLSITSMLDLSVDIGPPTPPATENYEFLRTRFVRLQHLLLEQQMADQKTPDEPTGQEYHDLHNDLYEEIWKTFDEEVLDANGWMARGTVLGQRFADFRGLLTCDRYPTKAQRKSKELWKVRMEKGALQRPFYRVNEDERGQWHCVQHQGDRWARSRLNDAWPFLMVAKLGLPGRLEFTVSRLLDGLQLYASALGPQPQEDEGASKSRPVFFYLHSATQCERQIGRTVDRLLQLGTLRLASIIALPVLKPISQELRELENQANSVREKLDALIKESNRESYESTGKSASRQEMQETALRDLSAVQTRLADIIRGNDESNKALGDESLSHRLSRSRYYRSQFEILVPDLRSKRLEGYQPYGEFVRRRLQSAFGFIDALERRVIDVSTSLRTLDQLYLSTAVTILTGEIEVSQNISAKIQKQALKTDKQVRKLQAFAELVLLVVLAPYYAFNLLYRDWWGCAATDHCDVFRFGWPNQTQWTETIIWLTFGAIWFVKTFELARKRGRRRFRRSVQVRLGRIRRPLPMLPART